jgi:hypothetical protein
VREGEAVSPTLGTRAPSRGEASGGRVFVIGGNPANAPATTAPAPAPEHPTETPPGAAPAAKPQPEKH